MKYSFICSILGGDHFHFLFLFFKQILSTAQLFIQFIYSLLIVTHRLFQIIIFRLKALKVVNFCKKLIFVFLKLFDLSNLNLNSLLKLLNLSFVHLEILLNDFLSFLSWGFKENFLFFCFLLLDHFYLFLENLDLRFLGIIKRIGLFLNFRHFYFSLFYLFLKLFNHFLLLSHWFFLKF